jgi:mono/diheme cytochrome c family protein
MKNNLFILSLLALTFLTCETAENKNSQVANQGQLLFEKNCTLCHGKDGKLKASGALDLSISKLSPEETLLAIINGSPQKGMPAYGARLKQEELNQLRDYVQGLIVK